MSGNPKFLISERNAVEFAYPTEYVPETDDIVSTTISSQNATQAILYAKCMTLNAAGSSGGLISIGVGSNQGLVLTYFQGSAVYATPVRVRFILSSGNGGVVTARLQDITNNLTIATSPNVTSTSPTMVSTTTVANVPTAGAVLQIQLTVNGLLNTGNFYYASLEFI